MKKFSAIYLFVLALSCCFTTNKVIATQIMGSDLTWRCVGQDSFLITLTVYRDCNGTALNSTPVIASCIQTGIEITRLTLNTVTPVDVTPVCNSGCTRCQSLSCSFPYGIQKYRMQGIIKLSGAGSCCNIKLTWEQCCRNASITTGAGNANFYSEAMLNRCISPCDNSPTFDNMPIAILCTGQDFTFCQGIQDIDVNSTGGLSDSFVFEWADPLSASSTPIAYSGSYSYNKPIYFWGFPNDALPFPRGIHLDSRSGCIQFRPMKPEVSVMVNRVSEYRNGVKIAELQRNIQIIVMACSVNTPPSITTPGNIRSKTVCAGDSVSFVFSTNDPNTGDSVSISWNNGISGAVWSNNNGLAKYPTGILSWIPTDAHVSSLPYSFTVVAKDNACPVRGSFVQSYQITVMPKPRANIIVTDSGGGRFWFLAQRIEGAGPVYLWQSPKFIFTPNTGSMIFHKFSPGVYPYTMTMTAGTCSRVYFDTVVFDSTTSIIDNRIVPSDFKIYPNPASDYIYINFLGTPNWEGKLMIYDHSSNLLTSKQLVFNKENMSFTMTLKGYSAGLYFFRLENATSKTIFKILLK